MPKTLIFITDQKKIQMKARQLSFAIIISILSFSSLLAQPLTVPKYEQMLEVAAEAEAIGDYYNALDWYDQAYKESKDKDLSIKKAEMYYLLRDYTRAEKDLDRVLKRDKEEKYKEQRYMHAMSLKALGRYEEAVDAFNIFIADTDSEEMRKKAQFELEGIDLLNALEQNIDVGFMFGGDKINNASGEASPRQYRDGNLYFSSFNRRTKIDVVEDEDYHSKIYYAAKSDGGFQKPKAIGEQVNRKEYHNANVSFSDDGRVMYFNRVQLEGTNTTFSKIFASYSKNETWSPAVEVEGINGDYITKQPAAGELFGNDVLFFVSDMDGGYGGFDIYYATAKGDGSFSSPINLGESINTAGDDVTPFYQDGNLYYSTNGLPTIGGFDIFQTAWDGSNWSKPKNMGFGYNSANDDLYLSYSADGNAGYIVSNRPDENKRKLQSKTCCDDIYLFSIRQVIIDLLATITDMEGNPLNGASLTLRNLTAPNLFSPDSKNLPENHEFQFSLDQDYEYELLVTKKGYKRDSIKFNTIGIIDNFTVEKTVALEKAPEVIEVEDPEYEIVTINQSFRLNSIYYDLDDDKILKDAEQDLKVLYDLMIQYPDMVIELSSHTDSQGATRYNNDLSQRRSESAKKWLTRKKISKDRIKAVGYGESRIINHCKNGVKCSDDEHRINRRTEFKIIAGPKSIEIKKSVLKNNGEYQGGKQNFIDHSSLLTPTPKPVNDSMPAIEVSQDRFDLGDVKKGEKRKLEYIFTNTGNADLLVEIVTACKCAELNWTREPIPPGGQGAVSVVYDSTTSDPGELEKVVVMVANTEPLVTELFFDVNVVE